MEKISLTKISSFVRKEYPILIISTVILTIFIYYVVNRIGLQNKNSSVVLWLGKITPGKTTSKELKDAIGSPIKTTQDGDTAIYSYPTTNEKRQTNIEIVQDVVNLIKEPVIAKERGVLQDYVKTYGKPDAVLYDDQYGFASPANFWGSRGLIVFANTKSGIIIEIWHFPSTSINQFQQQYPQFKLEPKRVDL